jgi:hypothetical protein
LCTRYETPGRSVLTDVPGQGQSDDDVSGGRQSRAFAVSVAGPGVHPLPERLLGSGVLVRAPSCHREALLGDKRAQNDVLSRRLYSAFSEAPVLPSAARGWERKQGEYVERRRTEDLSRRHVQEIARVLSEAKDYSTRPGYHATLGASVPRS